MVILLNNDSYKHLPTYMYDIKFTLYYNTYTLEYQRRIYFFFISHYTIVKNTQDKCTSQSLYFLNFT